MSTTQTARQLYPPTESPYEPTVGGILPNQVFPSDDDFPVNTGEPGFRLGTLHVEIPGVQGIAHVAEVMYRHPLEDETAQEGIIMGDLDVVSEMQSYFFYEPTEFYPVMFPVGNNRLLTIHYRDYAQKHPMLRKPYEVTVIIEFVEKHPAVEAITDADVRQRIYADLLNSDFIAIEIDPEKYIADPHYSRANELRQELNQFMSFGKAGLHPNVETQMLEKLSTKPLRK